MTTAGDIDATATAGAWGRAPGSSPPPGSWRRAWLTGLSVWGAATLTYALVNSLVWMTRREAGPTLSGMLEVWNRWDTGHYVTIAETGYNPLTENPAFFPLYPLLMRILEPVLPGGMLSAGLIVSSAACVVALAFIHRLVEDLLDTETAQRTTLYLMAFPFAFYLVAVYNQSLFLALAVGSLYAMRRGQWWYAGALAGLASATRQAGVLLAFAFAVEYLRQRDWRIERVRWDASAIALVPTGLIAFMIYSGIAFGDPLKFMHVQVLWGREASLPWTGTVNASAQLSDAAVDGFLFQPIVVLNVIDLLAVLVTLSLLVLSVVGPWRLGRECWYLIAVAAATFLLVLLTPIGRGLPPLHGFPRYALEILPAFIVLARMGANRYLDRLYLLPAMGVQAVLVLAFFNNIWLS